MTHPDTDVVDEYHLSEQEADLLLATSPWQRFVVLGDSSAEGLGEPTEGYRTLPWADRVREALQRRHPDLEYRNLGLRNLLAGQVREQQLGPALDFAPDLAAVVCGGNDLFTKHFDPDAVEEQIDGIIGPLRASGADVVTFGLMNISRAFPELAGVESLMGTLNERVRAVAARHDAMIVDMWDHPGSADRATFSSDMLHASMRGHALLAAQTLRTLGQGLAARAQGVS